MGATMTTVSDFVIPRFHDVLGDVMAHGHTHYWLHGGRGSTKSSFISICLVLLVVAFPQTNVVVVRRFGNTLRDSVYQQVLWAIGVLGLEGVFRAKVSPMEIVYVPTGQRIVFRGADDPLKLKGVKFTHGYCAAVWFEELDQFDGIEAVRSILNSLRRGGDKFWIFYSYNPPKTMWSWVNMECVERRRRADTLVRRSSYLDVMESRPEWIGQPFIDEAEYLRDVNERAWRWEYLGEVTGSGGAVFDNVRDERITDGRIRGLERVRNGVDWGGSLIRGALCVVGGSPQQGGFWCSRSTRPTRWGLRPPGRSWLTRSPTPMRREMSPTSTTSWCGATTRRTRRCR